MDIPTLQAQRIERNGARLLVARCPVCGTELVHGDSGSDFTHRASHCRCWAGYWLEAQTQTEEAQQ
jgi:hypothetical protein